MQPVIYRGEVLRWLDARHFGFIIYDGGEIFAHQFNVKYSPIQKGDLVTFEIGVYKDRPTAKNVQLVPDPEKFVMPSILDSAAVQS